MRALRSWNGMVLAVMGWLLITGLPLCAESILVRNKANAPVVVQGATVNRGMLVRDRPYLIQPGEATPPIALPGNKVLTIYDARNANRILVQIPVNAGMEDLVFDLQLDPNSPTGVRLDRVPRR